MSTELITKTNPFLFVRFAEYLGYVSDYVEEALDVLEESFTDDSVLKDRTSEKNFKIFVDAKIIYKKMLELYTPEEIQIEFQKYYDIILYKIDVAYVEAEATT